MRRPTFFLAVLVVFAGPVARAADVEFLRVWPGWRAADSFERISEYFGRGEPGGREIMLRTRPADRGGFYFLVRVKHDAALHGGRFALHIIRPDAPDAVTFNFPIAESKARETVYQLGLTGADWPGGKTAAPVAWKLELLAADGRVLADQKSFLWEQPAK
ncbi:MAG: hypothetical protein RIQ93_1558 [Verrucomicrobiota bacterium]|jgi:hypothetical protein